MAYNIDNIYVQLYLNSDPYQHSHQLVNSNSDVQTSAAIMCIGRAG
jgi:hypothetical protein